MMIRAIFYMALFFAVAAKSVSAQQWHPIERTDISVCETLTKPDFDGPECQKLDAWDIDPQNKHLWLRGYVDIPESMLLIEAPIGFYFLGKASAVFYVNGARIGANGRPALDKRAEEIGLMDSVLYLPRSVIKAGRNEVVIEMSGFNSYFKLAQPIHFMGIAPYQNPTDLALRDYAASIIPFGVLAIGVFYFGIMALRSETPMQQIWVPLMALFALMQLLAEISRGVVAYEWPMHDIRLLAILGGSITSSACLLIHVVLRFEEKYQNWLIGGSLSALFVPAFWATGFDGKTTSVFLAAAAIGLVISLVAYRRGNTSAIKYAGAFLVFFMSAQLVPTAFLDRYYYYLVAGLLVFLFAQQIRQLEEERAMHQADQARSERLQQLLDEANERTNPRRIKVSHEGRVEMVRVSEIAYCKGARDYVELVCANGKTTLCSRTLTELEDELAASFLRVHRSYLVNGEYADVLERENGGAGKLLLKTGEYIPVSRRIMPKVRKALI